MAIDLSQPFTNPITRETFRCLASTEEAYVMEWTAQPGGYVPFEHIHTHQDEIFHIKQGEMRAKIGGREQIGKTGDTVCVPRGVRHIAFNDHPEMLICIVEYKPGLDHYKTMQCFAGLTLDNDLDKRGLINIPKIMYLLRRINARSLPRPAFLPEWMFRWGMNVFYGIGAILGWERLYRKYTG